MGYLTTTGSLGLPYPDGAEDLDIPGDIQLLAEAVESSVTTIINDNVVTDAVLHVNDIEDKVEIVSGVMHIYLMPPDISLKYDKSGGTISGNVTITGTTTLQGAVTIPAPTLASHAVTKAYADNLTPIGLVSPYVGSTIPQGWYLCDGSAHNNANLLAHLGSPNLPDYTGFFMVGGGGAKPFGTTGGSASKTLTSNELPSHSHTINSGNATHSHTITVATGGGSKTPAGSVGTGTTTHTHSGSTGTESADHSHSGATGWMNQNNPHTHDAYTKEGLTTGDSDTWIDTSDNDGSGNLRWNTVDITSTDINHTHNFSTGGRSAAHTHSFTTGGQSANSTHGHTFTGTALNIDHGHTASSNSQDAAHTHTSVATGSGNAFDITPPYVAMKFIMFGGL